MIGDNMKILFVCHGNICRSPMAEFVMRDINLNGVIRTGFGIANFRYNFVKMLGNMFNIPCAFASFYLKFANSKIL